MSEWTLKEHSTGELTVTINGEEWKNDCKKAFEKLSKNVQIDGFRKGCAPKAMIEKRINPGMCQVEAVEDHMNEWLRAALKEQNVEPISQPTVDVKEVDADHAVVVYSFEVMPTVELGNYTGLDYELGDVSVNEEEFENEIKRLRETYADFEVKEGAAEMGDTVNIDYVGTKDGVAFDGGTANGYKLTLGSHSFIEGFEEGIVGMKAGDEKDLDLTFPAEYHEASLAGAPVVFHVKVNEVEAKVLPEVDDDFAKDVNAPGVETAEDLKKMIRERLESGKLEKAKSEAETKILDAVREASKVEIPNALIEEELQGMLGNISAQLRQYGMQLEQYLKMMGKTVDDLKNDYKAEAEKQVKQKLVLAEIAKAEKLEPEKEKIEAEIENLSKQYNMTVEKIKTLINEEMLKDDMRIQMAYDFIMEHSNGAPKKEDK